MQFCFSFGQSGGFAKLRDRFDEIMGFLKPDLTSSTSSEEKEKIDMTEKEKEEDKIKTADLENTSVIAESTEVTISVFPASLCVGVCQIYFREVNNLYLYLDGECIYIS